MSVKVISVECPKLEAKSSGHPMVYAKDAEIIVVIEKADVVCSFRFRIKAGFTAEASVPSVFSWFLPKVAKPNKKYDADVYNAGMSIHDGLYMLKGGPWFTREECDDILRGIWRESGIGRTKAGAADVAIGLFAGGKKHWGNDSEKQKDIFSMDLL